jgi:hypothetical protein
MKRKIARFEITQAGRTGEEFSEDPNDCELVLEIPTKFLKVLADILSEDLAALSQSSETKPDDLLCILVSGKPHPQGPWAPSWLADEYANQEPGGLPKQKE